PPASDLGTAEITADRGDRVEVRVNALSPSILLLTDTYHSGWHAEVDGAEVSILVANYAFRAVTVPAGAHIVTWRFRHPGLAAGAWLGLVGSLSCLSLVISSLVSRRSAVPCVEDSQPT